jgi:ribosomal protein L32
MKKAKLCRVCKAPFTPKYSTMEVTCGNTECKIAHGTKNRINKVSEKKKKEDRAYYALRDVFLKNHPQCKLNLQGCFLRSTDVHHVHRRGQNYLNVKTWMALCRNCHEYVERHPKESRERGWIA